MLIIFILIIVFAGAFLSLLKTALACCRSARLKLLAEDGNKNYSRALELNEKTEYYQSSLAAGRIFLQILLGCVCGYEIMRNHESLNYLYGIPALILIALVSCLVFYILTNIIPETAARSAPEKITAYFSLFIKIFPVFCFPLPPVEKFIKKLMNRIPGFISVPEMKEDEFRMALLEGEKSGIVESRERTMVEGVFHLGDRPAGAFMTHRSEVKWLDMNDSREKIIDTIDTSGQQYFPVADGELDRVTGIVSAQEVLLAYQKGSWPGLKSLMHTPCFIPETMPALKTFETFRKAGARCLFVMDEYGGFAGMLTVRNLIEEITGQLSTGSGTEEEIVLLDNGSWLADGSINIDTAAQALSLPSPAANAEHSGYHTLAGFILNLAGEIPKTGSYFDYNGYRFNITEMDGNRIEKITIIKLL